MNAMRQPTKDTLRETLACAADALIAERRKKAAWQHYAEDLIRMAVSANAEVRRLRWALAVVSAMAVVGWVL